MLNVRAQRRQASGPEQVEGLTLGRAKLGDRRCRPQLIPNRYLQYRHPSPPSVRKKRRPTHTRTDSSYTPLEKIKLIVVFMNSLELYLHPFTNTTRRNANDQDSGQNKTHSLGTSERKPCIGGDPGRVECTSQRQYSARVRISRVPEEPFEHDVSIPLVG